MINLNAITRGYAVPQHDFDAAVRSVFAEATKVRVGKTNRLLTTVTAECADLHLAMRVETPSGFSFEQALRPGDR